MRNSQSQQRDLPSSSHDLTSGYARTRRGLFAAAALFGSVLVSRGAAALGHFPRDKGGRGGTQCFLGGTHIRTPNGEVDIADLKAGDLVVTVSGEAKPIKSITRTRYERASHERWSDDILPIKVARSALGPQIPRADLFLSPTHALYVDGLLVPVESLMNGRSIARCVSFDSNSIEYFHIELDRHEVVFAEGAPVETLLDLAALPIPDSFAPRVATGWRTAVRSRLRSAASPWIDRRQSIDLVWERIAERADRATAA